jgi:glycosyltransferase involved in cell wall biosynthesis
MIIGIDASRANRPHKSGTEWYSYYAIRALSKLDSTNQYILYSDTPLVGGLADLTDAPLDSSRKPHFKKGFQILSSPHNNIKGKILKWPWKFFWTQGRLSLEMIFNAPDVLFVPAHALPIIHPKHSVVTIHDIGFRREVALYERTNIGAESSWRLRFINTLVRILTLGKFGANTFDYLDWSTKFSLSKAQAIIAISNFTKEELVDVYKAKGDKIHVIHNSYNSELYRISPHDDKAKNIIASYGIKHPYIFYVGRLEKKKNIAALVEAFYFFKSQWPELPHKLYLIGDASFGFDDIKYSIHGFRLENDVISTGWVAENDLPYIFSEADGFVFPSNYEGFGIPLLQAMATETPIAASRAASIPEIAGNAAILFDPANPREIAEAIHTLVTNEQERQRLVKAGREQIELFRQDTWAQKMLDLLESLK